MLVGCKSITIKPSKISVKEVVFQTISLGSLFGNGVEGISESTFTINNAKEWSVLLDKMNRVNNVSSSFKKTTIDFSDQMLVCVFDKVRSTGGISVEIKNISIENTTTKINYSIQEPAPGEMTITVVTQPYHIVLTQKRERTITFINKDN